MKGIDVKEINHRVSRGIAWVGKAALFCLGLLAMLALVVVMTVLTAVTLMSTILPAPAVRRRRDPRSSSAQPPGNSVPLTKNVPDTA